MPIHICTLVITYTQERDMHTQSHNMYYHIVLHSHTHTQHVLSYSITQAHMYYHTVLHTQTHTHMYYQQTHTHVLSYSITHTNTHVLSYSITHTNTHTHVLSTDTHTLHTYITSLP